METNTSANRNLVSAGIGILLSRQILHLTDPENNLLGAPSRFPLRFFHAIALEEQLTPLRIHNGIDTIQMIGRVLSNTFEAAKRKRLTNNSLLSTPLLKLPKLAEEFSELAEWIEMVSFGSESIGSIFDRARAEKERGEIYDLSQVD